MVTRKKAAPVEEVADVEEAAPKAEVRGTAWLTEFVNEECGTDYNSAAIRILLRKLVKDGKLAREIGEDRSRYNFVKGANDPIVKAVVKAVKSGDLQAERKESLDKAKATRTAKKAAATEESPARKARASSRKAKPAPEVIDEDEFEDEIEEL
jgi:hypothetical protein